MMSSGEYANEDQYVKSCTGTTCIHIKLLSYVLRLTSSPYVNFMEKVMYFELCC